MFLAITRNTIVDDPGDPNAVPPVPPTTHDEVGQIFLEDNVDAMVRNLELGLPIDYYYIRVSGPNLLPSIQPAGLRPGPRNPAPAREIVEIEAGGQVVGSAIITP